MKSLAAAFLEFINTPPEFKPHLCLHPNGLYQVVCWSNKKNIEKLMNLEVII